MRVERKRSLTLLATVILFVTCAANVRQAEAELLDQSKLADSKMHVVGVYSPEDSNKDDRIYVKILPTGKPMIIVMTGYYGAQWNVDIDPEADVRQIIVAGYFEHSIVGVGESVPVEMITSFSNGKSSNENYFWAYSLNNQRGRELQSRLHELTGLPIATFQGEYEARNFVVDGKRGSLNEKQESVSNLKQLASDEGTIESMVREAFEVQTQAQQARIAKAEADLQMIKKQFEYRQKMADQIIAKRVQQWRTRGAEQEAEIEQMKVDASADLLAAEGWELWTKRELSAALGKFQESIRIEPDNTRALNGLGWSLLQTGSYEKAVNAFEKTLKLQPNHGGAMNGIGQALMAQGKLDEAEVRLTAATETTIAEAGEATAVKRGVTASWFGLVRVLLLEQKFDEAEQWAERYLLHSPDDEMMKELLDDVQKAAAAKD